MEDELLHLLTQEVDNRLQKITEVFLYLREHPILLLDSPIHEAAREKIIDLRSFIRKQHIGFDQAVLANLTEKTMETDKRCMDYYIMSRSYHPLQNAMDDVWELL